MKTFQEWLIKENLDGYGRASTNYDDYSGYDDGEGYGVEHGYDKEDAGSMSNASAYVRGLKKGTKTPVMYRGKSILLTKLSTDSTDGDDQYMLGRRRMDDIEVSDMLDNGSLKVNWARVDDPSQRI